MRAWVAHMTAGLVATAACGFAAASPEDDGLFDRFEIQTPPAVHQTVLTGAFTDNAAGEIAVLAVDDAGVRTLRLYGFDGDAWTTRLATGFPRDALFVDVTRIADHDRLVAYSANGFSRFDPGAEDWRLISATTTDFRAAPGAGVPRVDVFRDLNGDGQEDLILPQAEGFRVALQRQDGTFREAVELGPAEPFLDARAFGDERTYGEVGVTAENIPWYLGRAHRLDYDRDGRQDLAFWKVDRFLLYRQAADGRFSEAPEEFETDVAFDFDGAYGLAFQFGDASIPALMLGTRRRTEHRVLHGFPDIDGDGTADLVVLTLAGRSPLRLRGSYEVHFGKPVPGGTSFPRSPDTVVRAPGRSGGLMPWGYAAQHYLDVDGDGALDMAMAAVNTGLFGMFRAIVGNSVAMDLSLYRLRHGRYAEKPDATLRLGRRFAPLDRRGPLFPTVLVGDVNGDGRADLVTGERWDELAINLGQDGDAPFAATAIRVAAAVPGDERRARLVDLDLDGKMDVVIAHPAPTVAGRIDVLMAR